MTRNQGVNDSHPLLLRFHMFHVFPGFGHHYAGQTQQGNQVRMAMRPFTISARIQMASSFRNAPQPTRMMNTIR